MAALSWRLFAPVQGLKPLLIRLAVTMLTWQERARQRNMLATMDDRLLRDIGISRAQARGEWEKPFWRV